VNVLPVGIVGETNRAALLKYFRHKTDCDQRRAERQKLYDRHQDAHSRGYDTYVPQQVVRIDREPQVAPDAHLTRELFLATRNYVHALRRAAVSDYGYGAATSRDRERIAQKGKLGYMPLIVDSRYRLLQYSGVTAATPNEPEVEEALGMRIGQDWQKLIAAGEQVMAHMKMPSLVITRGRDGMVAFNENHKPIDIPIFGSDQVADVTGAGTRSSPHSPRRWPRPRARKKRRNSQTTPAFVVMRGPATVTR